MTWRFLTPTKVRRTRGVRSAARRANPKPQQCRKEEDVKRRKKPRRILRTRTTTNERTNEGVTPKLKARQSTPSPIPARTTPHRRCAAPHVCPACGARWQIPRGSKRMSLLRVRSRSAPDTSARPRRTQSRISRILGALSNASCSPRPPSSPSL